MMLDGKIILGIDPGTNIMGFGLINVVLVESWPRLEIFFK